jgi:WD40 repeat protein
MELGVGVFPTITDRWQYSLSDCITCLARTSDRGDWAATSAAGELASIDRDGNFTLLLPPRDCGFYCLGYSQDDRYLAAGGAAEVAISFDGKTEIIPSQKWIENLAWHPHHQTLAYTCGNRVVIWTDRDLAIGPLNFDRSSIFDLAWHPDGSHLAVAGYKGVKIWSSDDWLALPQELAVDTATTHLSWSPDGTYLAAANLDRSISILDLTNPHDPWLLQGCPAKIRSLVWAGDIQDNFGLAVASGTEIVWWQQDPELGWAGTLWSGHEGIIRTIDRHPQSLGLLSVSEDGCACIRSLDGEAIDVVYTQAELTSAIWQPDGRSAILGTRSGQLGIWG